MNRNFAVDFRKGLAEIGYAVIAEPAPGIIMYEPLVRLDDGRNYSSEPQGEPQELWADSQSVATANPNDGYITQLEVLKLFDMVRSQWLGEDYDEENGTLAEYNNAPRTKFALAIRDLTDNNHGEILWYFKSEAQGRPARSGQTQEVNQSAVDGQFDTVSVKSVDRGDGLVRFKTHGNTIPYNVPYVVRSEPVTDESGKLRYQYREQPNDLTLATLSLGEEKLEPAFDADEHDYVVITKNATGTVEAEANSTDAIMTVLVNGETVESGESISWKEGANTVIVKVRNNGISTRYRIEVLKEA